MIQHIIQMLTIDNFYNVSENIEIAKGKNQIVTTWKQAKNKIKREWKQK